MAGFHCSQCYAGLAPKTTHVGADLGISLAFPLFAERPASDPPRPVFKAQRMNGTFDLVVRNGLVVTAADTQRADIGVRDGRIVALGEDLPRGTQDIDAAGRHVLPGWSRRPLPPRPADAAAGEDGRRLRNRVALGRMRRYHHGHPVRRAGEGTLAARGGRGLSPAGRRPREHRLRLPPDRQRSDARRSGAGIAGTDRRRLHVVQDLHDVRRPEARRRPDPRCARRGAVPRRDGDGARRELRLHRVADAPARSGGPHGAALARARAADAGRARSDAPRDIARRSLSTCRS